MNGTFKITMLTPLGRESGRISLIDDNGLLSGSVDFQGSKNPFRNGKANGNNFEFSGILRIGFGNIEYTASGTIVDDTLKATAKTKFGLFSINGIRV